jgi:hypothetical protein
MTVVRVVHHVQSNESLLIHPIIDRSIVDWVSRSIAASAVRGIQSNG